MQVQLKIGFKLYMVWDIVLNRNDFLMDKKNFLRKAMECEHHAVEIPLLAKRLHDEGMQQLDMYFLFEEFLIECDPNNSRYDSLVDTLDAIAGGSWAKGNDLYASELTNEKIEKNRKNLISQNPTIT